VSSIWYDFDKHYLLVVYSDNNIDLVFDSGRTINVADLMDSTVSGKTVNDVAFYDGKAYVATDFGLLIIDSETGVVADSGVFNRKMLKIGVTNDRIFVVSYDGSSYAGYDAPRSGRHGQWAVFSKTSLTGDFAAAMTRISDNQLLCVWKKGSSWIMTYENGTWTQTKLTDAPIESAGFAGSIYRTKNGGYMAQTAMAKSTNVSTYYYEANGNYVGTCASTFQNQPVGDYDASMTDLWVGTTDGIGRYNVSSKTYSVSPTCPQGISGSNVGCIRQASDGSLYFMTQGVSQGDFSNIGAYYIDRYKDGVFTKVYPLSGTATMGYKMTPDPINPDNFVVSSFYGIIRVYNGVAKTYNSSNSSISSSAPANMITDTKFDKDHNLYSFLNTESKQLPRLHMVPAATWQNGPTQSDFTAIDVSLSTSNHSSPFVIHSSGLIAYAGSSAFGVYDPATGKTQSQSNIMDEDGSSPSVAHWCYSMVEDKNGWIWCGMSGSLLVIKDPSTLFNSDFTVMRPKVPRNDGTNLADYLLDLITVKDISVDANNQKWFATYGSGLYHTSSDGTEILEHLTTANSSLPSDNLLSVCATDNGDVYIGTDQGLSVYHSSSTPAQEDFSSVVAFPNPVTPDYTGWVSITGLMDNSLVKITDAVGTTIYSTTSNGGQVMWDCCDTAGNRVKSGVYFVFASQSGGTASVVTKILVVN
jgi:ligand-binding sensor domain-containing protein